MVDRLIAFNIKFDITSHWDKGSYSHLRFFENCHMTNRQTIHKQQQEEVQVPAWTSSINLIHWYSNEIFLSLDYFTFYYIPDL